MSYKSEDIRVLDEITHVQINPGTYIGITENPIHLIEEALDNSLDEAMGGHAKIIAIKIDNKSNIFEIIDNGRGIPIENDVPITISSKLFSGSKFQDDKKSAYKISCLVGNTKIKLLDGRDITIKEMSDNPNEEYWELASTTKAEWKATKLLHPQITGYTKNLIRVHLDNGLYEECTPDHLWMLRDGSYKEAKDLKEGDSLMSAYFTEFNGYNHKVIKIENVILDEEVPVYDVNSPIYSNFVLSSGVVVHNSGLNGIGLVTLNALSDFYNIEIYRDNKHATFEFKNAKFFKKEIKEFKEERPFSTRIQFKPSKKIFEKLSPDIDRIRNRILFASIELTDVTFVLMIDGEKEIIKTNIDDYFKNYCLSNSDTEITDIIDIKNSIESEKFNIRFCYSINGAITPKVQSSVNLLPVDSGGTHINYFYDILREFFLIKAKKLGIKFQSQDCLCGLRAYLSLALKKPEFSGQTKDKLINRKSYLEKLATKLKSSIEDYFNQNQEKLEILLRHFEAYRKNIDAKKLKGNNGIKRGFTKFTKLRDCTNRNGELFVCEGNSAGGSLIQCRDPKLHAILPLKGKIPNVVNAKDILKNVEVGELIQALGTGIGKHFDISKLRYSKIICAADADPDGAHISSLLTMVLSILVPDIIKSGHYYIAITPLYAINEKKVFIPLWSKEELEKAIKENRKLNRFKGLGEMNPNQLKKCLIDEKTRKLIPVTYSKNIEDMIKLFSEVSCKRELLKNDSIDSIIK